MVKEIDYKALSVGEIVALNYSAADVLHQYGIDFCCHGQDSFENACAKASAHLEDVIQSLNELNSSNVAIGCDFSNWPKDLLIDYILKIHHRGIRREGPITLHLLDKVESVHGEKHTELYEVRRLFAESLVALEEHLLKEEEVLFPYLYELWNCLEQDTKPGEFHCGSVVYPIDVMMHEHDGEGERYREISRLTDGFTPPEDACESYKLVLRRIADFEKALHEHIHLENNILFPWAIRNE